MSEMDPSAITGNTVAPATVEELSFECYEDAWRGFAEDYRPRQFNRELSWGHYVSVEFDPSEPGIVKAIAVETPEEVVRFSGVEALEAESQEREILGRLLGVDSSAFARPPKIDPDTLSTEEREVFFSNRNNEDPLFAYGEAFGQQPAFPVTVDTELAQELYDQAMAKVLATWGQERLAAELTGVGFITGDRDEPRVEVLARHIYEHPEYREAIKAAVDDAIDISTYPTSETIWPHNNEAKAALAVLRQILSSL